MTGLFGGGLLVSQRLFVLDLDVGQAFGVALGGRVRGLLDLFFTLFTYLRISYAISVDQWGDILT